METEENNKMIKINNEVSVSIDDVIKSLVRFGDDFRKHYVKGKYDRYEYNYDSECSLS